MNTITPKRLQAEIYNVRFWVDTTESSRLKTIFGRILSEVGFNVLHFKEQHFPMEGYTAFWLLAESHLAVHTFPDDNWSYIELSSCNKLKSAFFQEKVESMENINITQKEVISSFPG
ncbi:MAG TPA: S-adenosylmethionine decarboxylase [Sunxiuqinia sp.]|nr:S-adenosylmethionine decarboxylase [Sunxiuqinia sp.]